MGLVMSIVASACTRSTPADEARPSATALTWSDDVDLTDLTLAVGAKSTTEQSILGWLAVEALESAGAAVTDELDLGTTLEARDALLGGFIDLYWEYTGTGWVELLREIGPSSDADELAAAVADTDLDENDIAWLDPAPADSSYALVRGDGLDGDLDVDSIGALGRLLADRVAGAVVCLPAGGRFPTDPAGLPALATALDLRIRDGQLVPVPGDEIVELTEAGAFCPFAQVNRTSPQLADADVRLLDDDVGAFLIRNPAVTVRAEVLTEFPGIAAVLDQVAEALTDTELRELNASAAGGRGARTVARQWLVDEDLADF